MVLFEATSFQKHSSMNTFRIWVCLSLMIVFSNRFFKISGDLKVQSTSMKGMLGQEKYFRPITRTTIWWIIIDIWSKEEVYRRMPPLELRLNLRSISQNTENSDILDLIHSSCLINTDDFVFFDSLSEYWESGISWYWIWWSIWYNYQ